MALPRDIPCEEIMESLADGVFTVDTDFTITFFNRAAGDIAGLAPAEALGRKCWEVFHSSLCDRDCALGACIRDDATLSEKAIFIVRPDGRKVPVSISAAPLRDASGRIVGGVETFRDISDLDRLRKELQGVRTLEDIVTRNREMARHLDLLPPIAQSGATVLLLGESGTGKELFARALHNLSSRAAGPFVAVNCGAIPGELLESELFGHARGAFTDAKSERKGRFALATGGTLFLDEIGELPLPLQVKLLRVLQERVYEPLGSDKTIAADVRILAATNRDLEAMAASGAFRRDLFYRLSVARIALPPLRERPEDIPLLVATFIERLNLLREKSIVGVRDDALRILLRHDYPGNVRELQNILEYAFILCPSGRIGPEHLPDYLRPSPTTATLPDTTPHTMRAVKYAAAKAALDRHHGKTMAACRELDVTKDTLRRILEKGPGETGGKGDEEASGGRGG
ncbi:sigma-54 interaction domain-containing protein [Solidesulfovibrio alcoholivorans]|uniref:sigma-54 interaction domain-containing protein n=1 Tax=Solidesulfovibrio alcoholivorans TaxID=81406 RepID=UPI000694ED1E|nr:sigma 54-interacting transcriptional regulator [Solidesulfovibrio alcoholivorans]